MLPAGVPADVVKILDKSMAEIARKPDFQNAIHNQGLEVTYMDSAAATKLWNSEVDKWSKVIKEAGIKAE